MPLKQSCLTLQTQPRIVLDGGPSLSLDLGDGMIPVLLAYRTLPGKRTSPTADTLSLARVAVTLGVYS